MHSKLNTWQIKKAIMECLILWISSTLLLLSQCILNIIYNKELMYKKIECILYFIKNGPLVIKRGR